MKFKILYQKGSSSFKEEKSNIETLTINEEINEEVNEEINEEVNEEINSMNKDIWIFLHKISRSIKNYWLQLRIDKNKNKVSIENNEDLYKSDLYKLVSDQEIDILIEKTNQVYNKLLFECNLQDNQNYLMKMTIHQNSKVAFFGDYHSSLHSLAECLLDLKNNDFFISEYSWILKDNNYIVFTGDLVDRGPYGIECLYLVYQLFILNNSNTSKVIILNGNHEEENVYDNYGFRLELDNQIYKYDIKERFESLIKRLPLALFLKYGEETEWYQFCHGAIDEEIQLSNFFIEFLNNDYNILVIPEEFNGLGFLWNDITNDNINDLINDIFEDPQNDKINIFNNINLNRQEEDRAIEQFQEFLQHYTVMKSEYFDYFNNISYLKNLIKLKFLKNNVKLENFIRQILIKKNRTRNVIFKDILQYVLENNNIKLLISGHQDFANLGLVIKDEFLDENYIDHEDYKKSYEINTFSHLVTYESHLKTIEGLNNNSNDMSSDNTTINLNLNTNELLGIVTSSAVIPRNVPFSIYGILNSQNITMNYFKSCTTHTWINKDYNNRNPIALCNYEDKIKGFDLIQNNLLLL